MIVIDSSTEKSLIPNDESLIRDCVRGDQLAWCALIDKYKNLIFSIPLKLGFTQDDAGDVFQNVCLTLLSELSRLREPKTLPAWLIRVTLHECFHWRKEHLSGRVVDVGETGNELAEPGKLPDAVLDDLRREQILRDCISELADRCRELIRLLFLTTPAMPYEQVAVELGIAKGSIGFIRMRCLQRLRRRLEEKGFI